MTNNIVVTGPYGFIGREMIKFLLENTNYRVFGVCRFGLRDPDKKIVHERYVEFLGDITYEESVKRMFKEINPKYFINFAGIPKEDECEACVNKCNEIHVTGVLNILATLVKYNNAGSVYQLNKNSLYGSMKAAAGEIIAGFRAKYNIYAIQPLLSHIESKDRSNKYFSKLVSEGVARIKNALDNYRDFAPIELKDTSKFLDFCHVSDIVEGIWKSLNQELPKDYIFISEKEYSLKEFVKMAFSSAQIDGDWFTQFYRDKYSQFLLKKDGIFTKVAVPLANSDGVFAVKQLSNLNREQIQKDLKQLNWAPKISFEQLIYEMVSAEIKKYDR